MQVCSPCWRLEEVSELNLISADFLCDCFNFLCDHFNFLCDCLNFLYYCFNFLYDCFNFLSTCRRCTGRR